MGREFKEAIALCLEVQEEEETPPARFVGVQRVAV
jgi:predicted RNase H-like HicB family nuclease